MRTISNCFFLVIFCAGLIACTAFDSSESTGEYIDGSISNVKIKTQLIDELGSKAMPIQVKVLKDEVQLSGFVSSEMVRNRAGIIARENSEINKVFNNLIVKN